MKRMSSAGANMTAGRARETTTESPVSGSVVIP